MLLISKIAHSVLLFSNLFISIELYLQICVFHGEKTPFFCSKKSQFFRSLFPWTSSFTENNSTVLANYFFLFEEILPWKTHFVCSGERVKFQLSQTLTGDVRSDSNLKPVMQILIPLSSRHTSLGFLLSTCFISKKKLSRPFIKSQPNQRLQ